MYVLHGAGATSLVCTLHMASTPEGWLQHVWTACGLNPACRPVCSLPPPTPMHHVRRMPAPAQLRLGEFDTPAIKEQTHSQN